MNPTPILQCRNVVKSFGEVTAINGVSLEVSAGDIVGLVGASGSGKTTLINVLSGHYPADSGQILFDEQDITQCTANQLAQIGLARTFQIPRPFTGLTVIDNVALGRIFGRDKHSRRDAMDLSYETLDFVGLHRKARLPVARLNWHERKVLEVARALALEPKLLLIDEVLAGWHHAELDTGIDLIQRIGALGITIILVEHHRQALLELSDRLVMLHDGQVVADGLPHDVMSDTDTCDFHHPKI